MTNKRTPDRVIVRSKNGKIIGLFQVFKFSNFKSELSQKNIYTVSAYIPGSSETIELARYFSEEEFYVAKESLLLGLMGDQPFVDFSKNDLKGDESYANSSKE